MKITRVDMSLDHSVLCDIIVTVPLSVEGAAVLFDHSKATDEDYKIWGEQFVSALKGFTKHMDETLKTT